MDCCFNLQPAFSLSLPLDSVCVDRRLKCNHLIGKLLSSNLLVLFTFPQFVILENLSVLDLALLGLRALNVFSFFARR